MEARCTVSQASFVDAAAHYDNPSPAPSPSSRFCVSTRTRASHERSQTAVGSLFGRCWTHSALAPPTLPRCGINRRPRIPRDEQTATQTQHVRKQQQPETRGCRETRHREPQTSVRDNLRKEARNIPAARTTLTIWRAAQGSRTASTQSPDWSHELSAFLPVRRATQCLTGIALGQVMRISMELEHALL